MNISDVRMTRLIKKYKNRRLYDTDISRYITMDDVLKYVLDNIEFTVVDSSSGNDLTNQTLLQVMLEKEASVSHCLSQEMLKQFIRMAHHPLSQPMKQSIEDMLRFMQGQMDANPMLNEYQKASEQWQSQVKDFYHLFNPKK